jgi:aminopeptidase N
MSNKGRVKMAEQSYKYRREDFGELPIKLNHLTIYLNFLDEFVEATNLLDITAIQPLDLIELDAKDLKIVQVEWVQDASGGKEPALSLNYDYLENRNKLVVKLPRSLQAGERFLVRTVTRCVPSDRLLEGIYQDTSPPGAPQQYVSQCQQWGFQRIMPIFDDCRAKCTMTTTLEADARYTHLISNGNISKKLNPGGKPITKPGNPSRQIITYENPIPMAPYLFLVAAGTWDVLSDAVTYESGRTVQLEYLVPPGRVNDARIPMEILKQSVLWISKTQDYEYTGETYRTICMNKSNFGGMENVGNTTVVTDAALIDEHTLDRSLMYAHAVIVHEFEHNQCGSETTMETPFDVWLNEAYTVDVERAFMADVFDPAFVRLAQVDSIRSPLLGPLSIEDGGHAGRIVRDGFDDPDDLIDGVTYVKAAEVIRMLRLIVGVETFRAGKNLYFSRYRDSNANTDQFFECFEEVSGRSLDLFKKSWLYRIGYPHVAATTHYDPARRKYHIDLRQESATTQPAFHLPLVVALVDGEGRFLRGTEQVFEFTQEASRLTFSNISEEPAFASLNRDYSFYGAFQQENASPETLASQVRLDANAFNRVEAMRRLTDRERINLLADPGYVIDPQWIRLYGEILADRSLPAALKAYFIRIEEQPLDREYCTWYRELVVAREKLMLAVNRAYLNELKDAFHQVDTYRPRQSPRDGIEDRILKHVLLDLIAIDDSSNSYRLIMDHYRSATTAADRVAALLALNRSSAPERCEILEQAYDAWHTHLSGYGNYLVIIGAGTRDDVFDMIELERKRPSFDITQPTWGRALFLSMASNNKMVWTNRGIQWVADTVIELSRINAFTAGRLLNTFQHARKLKPDLQSKVIAALEAVVRAVPQEVSPSLHGQAKAYLE